jgi:cytochrome c
MMPTVIRGFLIGFGMLAAAWWMPIRLAWAAGDPAAGAKSFRACAACHSLHPGVNMTEPSLAGIWGRTAGGLSSFPRYSPALAQSGVVWNEQTLDRWLANPAGFIPNNEMTFQGIADVQTRADLVALLRLAGPNGPTGVAASAPEVIEPDLKSQPAARQVRAIQFCDDTYRVTTIDGSTTEFWEHNLRFETDSSARGPKPDVPTIMPAGMLGDRAAVIFFRPEEIDTFIKRAC